MSTRQPKTLLQISLRSVLAAISVLCVLLAVLAPLVRAQPPDLRRPLLWVILISAAVAVVGLVYLCLRRWRVEMLGGELLLRPKFPRPWLEYVLNIFIVLVTAGFLAGFSIVMLPDIINLARWGQESVLPRMFFIVPIIALTPQMLCLVYGFTMLWWRVSLLTLEIRENGIGMGGLRFIPWRTVTGYHWIDGKHGAVLTILCSSRKHVAVLSFDTRDAVQELLDAHVVSTVP
jgi:hypothetical protein